MVPTLIVVALLLAGIAAGILSAGVVAVRPALHSLSTGSYIVVKQAFDRSYPRVMKPLQLTTVIAEIVLTIAAATDGAGRCAVFAGLAAASTVTSVVVTVAGDQPINIAMASWSADAPPADWESQRARWDGFNVIRTAAAVAALLFLAFAAIAPH